MFKRIELDNYRSFTHAVLDLNGTGGVPKNYGLIYGENGSGKTNLIESVAFLKQSMRTLVIGDDISGQRVRIQEIDGDGSELVTQVKQLTDMALKELELAASAISISQYVNEVRTIGSDTPLGLRYVFELDGRDATYELGFSMDGKVTHEKLTYLLNDRIGRYFEMDQQDGVPVIKLGSGLFTNKRFKAQMKELACKFWGNHTFLALLYAECRRSNPEYIREGLRPEMISLITYLDDIVVNSSRGGLDVRIWPIDILGGSIPAESESILDAYGEAIDTFFTRLYTDIGRVYYQKIEKDGRISYSLMFRRRISEVYRDIPAAMESAGTRKLLSLIPALLECAKGSVVFIDELDSGIHDKLIHDLMGEVLPSVRGQMIVTTHNTSLIGDTSPSMVYVISIDALGNKDIRSIDTIARTQRTHNNTARYLNGQFGGVPYIGVMDLQDIAETLDENLRGDA